MLQGPQVSQYAQGLVAQQEAERQAAESAAAIGAMVREEELERFLRRKALEEKAQLLEAAKRQEKMEQHEMLMSAAGEMAREEQELIAPNESAGVGDLADIIQAKVYGGDEVLPLLQARNEKQSMIKQSNEGGGSAVVPLLAGAGLMAGGAAAARNPAVRSNIQRLLARFGSKADDVAEAAAPAAVAASGAPVAKATQAISPATMADVSSMPNFGASIPSITKTSFFRRGIGDRSKNQLGLVGIGNEQALNEYLVQQTPNTTGDRVRDAAIQGSIGLGAGGLGGVMTGLGFDLVPASLRADIVSDASPVLGKFLGSGSAVKRLGLAGAGLGALSGVLSGAIRPNPNINVFDAASGAPMEGRMSGKERRSIINILNRLKPGEQEDNFNIAEGEDLGRAGRNLDALIGYGVDLDEAMEEDEMLRAAMDPNPPQEEILLGNKYASIKPEKLRAYALEKASEFALGSVMLAAQGREKKASRARQTATQIIERLLK